MNARGSDPSPRSAASRSLKVEELTSESPGMTRCLRLASLASESDVPVLVLGETGTGKTLLVRAIHNSSRRASGPFVSFNSSAISDTLLESQLFGHERGAFTGADKTVRGKFELSDSGTLFLDEIADMSALAQAKILRAVEYGEFERLGSERIQRSNARIIAATNSSLPERIREGRFREDLYYRLSGLTLRIPPLRERPEDLPALIASELELSAREAGKHIVAIHPDAMTRLLSHPWRGNLRELSHTMRTVVLFCDGDVVLPEMIVFDNPTSASEPAEWLSQPAFGGAGRTEGSNLALSRAIAGHVRTVYELADRNQRKTAKLLGISRATLSRHLKNLELK